MTNGENEKRQDLLKEKKGLIVDEKTGRSKRTAAYAAVAVVVTVVLFRYYSSRNETASYREGKPAAEVLQNVSGGEELSADRLVYDQAQFADGRARFFNFRSDLTDIGYFIVKGPDGRIRAAFNACDVCWRAGKGYSQGAEVMVCNNCDREFPLDMIGQVSGGCNPAPLESSLTGGKVIIMKSDIVKGLNYFKDVR